MQATIAAARAALEAVPTLQVQESDGYLLVTPAGEAVPQALFCRQAGWITAVTQLVEEDSPALDDRLLQTCFALSEGMGIVRVVRTNAGLWLRGDVPDPAQVPLLVAHLARAARGLAQGGPLAAAFAVQTDAPLPSTVELAQALAETGFGVQPFPELEGWQLRDAAHPGGRPMLARSAAQQDALVLLVGIHEAPEAELPAHFIETLLQVNDHLQASRLVLVAGLGLMVQAVVPLPATPAQLSAWLAQGFADAQQAVRSLAPAQDDLPTRIRLLRAWLLARVQEGLLTEPAIAAAVRAEAQGAPLPDDLPLDPLLPKVIAEVTQILFHELPARQPQAQLLMRMGVENTLRGRPLDEVWEVALDYLGETL